MVPQIGVEMKRIDFFSSILYKTGISNHLNGKNFKPERKNVKDKKTDTNCKEQGVKSLSSDSGSSSIIYVDDKSLVKVGEGELCSFSHNDDKQMCSLSRDITRWVRRVDNEKVKSWKSWEYWIS